MLEFITGQAGSGKTTLMFDRIKNNSGKQLVIVPEQFSYEFDKKLYFFLGAERFNQILSLSFTGLARHLFQLYGESDRKGEYADDYARMILIYQAISAVQADPEKLVYFRKQSAYNGFSEEVLEMINEMKHSAITPDILIEKAPHLDKRLMDKTNDIADIYLEYNRLMQEYGFKDNLENIVQASETASRENFFKGMNVYIDEFEGFSGDQMEMLKTMIRTADNVYITLRTDNVNAGSFTLFDTVNETYHRIKDISKIYNVKCINTKCGQSRRFKGEDLHYLSSHIMRNFRYSPEKAPVPENIRIFEAKDMYTESEYVCATIKHLICENPGLRYRDIAVLANNIEEYADILKETYERCDIPYFLSIAKPVAHSSVMVFFTSLLEILTSRKIKSEHIFRLMKCGILDIKIEHMALVENYCYKWNIDKDTWTESFTADDENLEMIENIRQTVINPLMKLKKKVSGRNVTAIEICGALYNYLVECNAENSVGRLMGELIRQDRDYESAELKRLWACIIDILDSVSSTLGERVISFSETARIMKSMIGKLEYSVPPQTLDSVITASARTARLSDPKVVFVMGANDGNFPGSVSIQGLFSDSDKRTLSENGINISRSLIELVSMERLVVYKSLSSASEKVYITYPLSDLTGNNKYPSQVTDSIMKMFNSDNILITQDNISLDYYAVTMHSAFYHYMQNINANNKYTSSVRKILESDPEYKRRIAYITERSAHKQDFTIDTDVMQNLKSFAPLNLSATALEKYSQCHFMYFCEKFMKLHNLERVEIDNRIAGDIIHACLAGILRDTPKEEFIVMSAEDMKSRIEKYAEIYKNENLAGDFAKSKSFDFLFGKIIENLIIILIHIQKELQVTSFTPVAFEAELAKNFSLWLTYDKNRKICFSGTVDRADTCTIGDKKYLRVIDYKSSRKKITPENLAGGLNLQMLLYLFTATEKKGMFRDCIPAGVLYSPIYPDSDKNDETSSLKYTGLVLGRRTVLNAMEHGINGEYIPVKFKKNNELSAKDNSCVAYSGMEWLRDYVYDRLRDMASSLIAGNVSADPLCVGIHAPCDYCEFVNICDNSMLTRYHTPDEDVIEETKEVLSNHLEKEEE